MDYLIEFREEPSLPERNPKTKKKRLLYGYHQPGRKMHTIAVAMDRNKDIETYLDTVFHEFSHFVIHRLRKAGLKMSDRTEHYVCNEIGGKAGELGHLFKNKRGKK